MTRRTTAVFSLVGLALLAFPLAGEAREPALSAPPERPAESYDPATVAAIELFVHSKLLGEQVSAGLAEPIEIELGAARLRKLAETTPGERPLRVGAKKKLGVKLDLAAPAFGAKRADRDGTTVWTGVVRSDAASAIRLEFTDFDLPRGHELYLYSADGQVRGPYTGRGPLGKGTFWSHTIFSAEVTLQLRAPAGAATPPFTIRRVGHMGPKFRLPAYTGGGRGGVAEKTFCNFNASCVENAACGSSGAVGIAESAVAEMLFASGGGFFICTGGLLADTDTSSVRELFLTANHCISRGSEAASLETFFDFTTPCNTPANSCPDFENGSYQGTVGATILKSAKRSDYTLMELAQPAPGGVAYLGWNATPVANSNGTPLFRISHPSGAPQAYSEHDVDTSKGTCGGWPRGRWIYSNDTYGATEGGSSGSPVVNASGEVVGQLTGACGTNVGDVCDAGSNATVDGAFAAYFSQISSILDPDGGDPGGGCTPGPKAKGDSCSDDSECQSCKCKGPANNKTCK